MEKYEVVYIPERTIKEYNKLMAAKKLDYEKHDVPRYETIESWTVNFGDGFEADLKICSSDNGAPLWCEAVLFENGQEITCTDLEDKLDGVWELNADEITFYIYITPVKVEKTDKNCPHCGGILYTSDLPDYAYVCFLCDENFYNIEVRDSVTVEKTTKR